MHPNYTQSDIVDSQMHFDTSLCIEFCIIACYLNPLFPENHCCFYRRNHVKKCYLLYTNCCKKSSRMLMIELLGLIFRTLCLNNYLVGLELMSDQIYIHRLLNFLFYFQITIYYAYVRCWCYNDWCANAYYYFRAKQKC